jgi:acyl-CoA thioester hydrolase
VDKYTKEIKVCSTDLDELDHVNNVRYVQWIQDIAKEHWFKKSTSTMNKKYFWVVASHEIEYKRSAFLNDSITLVTYVEKSERCFSTRIVKMYNSKTNKLLVDAKTRWCLMSVESRTAAEIPESISSLFN